MDNKITEAIVLAGVSGNETGEIPRSLTPVNGKPFLIYLLGYLKKNGITNVLLSVEYKHQMIIDALGDSFEGMKITYAIGKEPLDTGGGIKLALENTKAEVLFVINGDVYFDIDLGDLSQFHFEKKSTCSVALARVPNANNSNHVEVNEDGKVIAFNRKQQADEVVVNTGVYCINKGVLIHYPVNTPFSFEKNYLENNPKAKNIFGKIYDADFLNIGLPDDLQKFANNIQT